MAEYDDNRQLLVWRMGSFGYKTPDGKSYYYLKDHLGNIRVVVNENKEIVSKNDYYPFGMQIEAKQRSRFVGMPGMCYNDGNSNDRYKYSSKELETIGSLSKYHYGFREYDPEIGRWNRVDPLCFQTPGQSPYNFVANNPVNHYDVAGLILDDNGALLSWAIWANTWSNNWDATYGPSNGEIEYRGDGGVTGSASNTGGGAGYLIPIVVFKYDSYEKWTTPGYNANTGEFLGYWTYEWYDNPRWEVDWGDDIPDINQGNSLTLDNNKNSNLAEKIFGPKAKPTDSWLWRAFRGTGNIKEDIFNASMLSLTIPIATIGAAEATAYIAAEAPYLASGWEAASAEMYSGWTTAALETKIISSAIVSRFVGIATVSSARYLANKPLIDHIFFQFLKGYGFKIPGNAKNWPGLIAFSIGRLMKNFMPIDKLIGEK